ncbi:Inner membrane protein YhaH [Halioglobus japonicus]|nr:Inner membrane protein YhaH [Halioglobus japonicus]
MNWYLEVIRKYAQFSGRARRKEYWFFVLFNLIISIALTFVDSVIGTLNTETGYGVLSGIYSLAVLIPSLAVSFRRLHDTGRNAWWLLIGLIPIIGAIVLLVFMVQDSQEGENEYGASPKLEV